MKTQEDEEAHCDQSCRLPWEVVERFVSVSGGEEEWKWNSGSGAAPPCRLMIRKGTSTFTTLLTTAQCQTTETIYVVDYSISNYGVSSHKEVFPTHPILPNSPVPKTV